MPKGRRAKVIDKEPSYVVERIVDHTKIRGRVMYRIRWEGYSSEEDTWQVEEDLDCPEKLADYWKQVNDDDVEQGAAEAKRGPPASRRQKQRRKRPVPELIPEPPRVISDHSPVDVAADADDADSPLDQSQITPDCSGVEPARSPIISEHCDAGSPLSQSSVTPDRSSKRPAIISDDSGAGSRPDLPMVELSGSDLEAILNGFVGTRPNSPLSEDFSRQLPDGDEDAVGMIRDAMPQSVYAVSERDGVVLYRVLFADGGSGWVPSVVLSRVAPDLMTEFLHTKFDKHYQLGADE
jgi:hypothetical protein